MSIIYPLFSGSSGNCEYICYGNTGILIDAGVSAKRLTEALDENGIQVSGICAIFVTHEHSDHITGLRVFASKHGIPVFCSSQTKCALLTDQKIRDSGITITEFENSVQISDFTVKRFSTSHDCNGSSGYRVYLPDGKSVAICTDLGYISEEVSTALDGCDTVMIESNHDLSMLRNGPYSLSLKTRIASDKGHLSNACCADILPRLVSGGTKQIILAHLSKENNREALARDTAVSFLSVNGYEADRDYSLTVAPPSGGKPVIIQ